MTDFDTKKMKLQKLKLYIFPPTFLWVGVLLFFVGLLSGYFCLKGGRPNFFDFDVFAFYSTKLRSKFFTSMQNNVLDELAGILTLSGLFIMFFTKTRFEDGNVTILRIRAVFQSMIITTVFAILLFVFVYGWPIFAILACLFYFFLLCCFLMFRISYFFSRRK